MSTLVDIAEVAKHQEGYVATYQVDVSRQMFSHHESKGRLERVLPGIYRMRILREEPRDWPDDALPTSRLL